MRAMDDWPFDQARNCAVLTVRGIAFDGAPVLHVVHDAEDHGWQFLTLDDADPAEAAVVSLGSMVARDPSLLELADLPPGWRAWRESARHAWRRESSG